MRDKVNSFLKKTTGGSIFVTSMRNIPSFTMGNSRRDNRDNSSETHFDASDGSRHSAKTNEENMLMTEKDLAQYVLKKTETVGAKEEKIVRMDYVRKNSIYEKGVG